MLLREYTAQETDELIGKFHFIADCFYAVNREVLELMTQKHRLYLQAFKPSLFRWKSLNFKDFVKTISSSEPDFNNIHIDHHDPVLKDLFPEVIPVLRMGCGLITVRSYFSDYGVPAFTEDEILSIKTAAFLWDLFYCSNIPSTYVKLMKYAKQPFCLEEHDIAWIERIESLHKRSTEWYITSQRKSQENS